MINDLKIKKKYILNSFCIIFYLLINTKFTFFDYSILLVAFAALYCVQKDFNILN